MTKSGHWSMHEYSIVDERGNSLNNEQEHNKIVCFVKYSPSTSSSSSDSLKKKTRLPPPSNPRKETSWPGFHFIPTDEELVGYYLSQRKLFPRVRLPVQFIRDVDVYGNEDPWTLFNIRDESKKYCFYVFTVASENVRGKGVSRKAGSGSWNHQKSVRVIDYKQRLIGVRAHYNFITEEEKKKKKKERDSSKSTRDGSKMEEEEDHGRWTMHEYSVAEESKEGNLLKSVEGGKVVRVICCNMSLSIRHYF